MLSRKDYRERWKAKLQWYLAHGVHPVDAPAEGAPTLVTTKDSPETGLDMGAVRKLIAEVCGG